eukprot:TRINITY_DN104182_c0_g1_i1.p1 TRINITY_DN104182_c0_g1~~TRINITY_DN104182_c0_g1_i1.p1  ORF type:complete len:460 (-),score=54.30 TRINITY_DN104182_c0_g1_i1:237-1460(-)
MPFRRGSAAVTGAAFSVTGLKPGPFPVGVTTVQFDDHSRSDPEGGPRSLQTEIWYPAADEASKFPRNRCSEFLGRGAIPGSIAAAESEDAIGGYRLGLTVEELDSTWPNDAVRDARPQDLQSFVGPDSKQGGGDALDDRWPLVVFSHGSGAFRASYVYFTEYLASQGFVVVACDHPGSARYTQVSGRVVKPGGARSDRSKMEDDRPKDLLFLINSMERLANGGDSRFAGRIDTSRVALTGMSFGGWSAAVAAMEHQDARVRAVLMQCPSLMSAGGRLMEERKNLQTPVMIMIGTEDTVIGERGNELCRQFAATHEAPSFLLEIKAAGHVSFTSCELYNPNYGNGIGESKSLTKPGSTYTPLPPDEQHAIINSYALAFLNAFLRGGDTTYLEENHFGERIAYDPKLKR